MIISSLFTWEEFQSKGNPESKMRVELSVPSEDLIPRHCLFLYSLQKFTFNSLAQLNPNTSTSCLPITYAVYLSASRNLLFFKIFFYFKPMNTEGGSHVDK